jgi:2-polyprenyl-3-methyl-5-hydroxy-6-metoxy-1,4-benzoquinol methylase
LQNEGVGFQHHEFLDLEGYRPDVVFVPNPYEESRPESLQIPALEAVGARVAYIPYGLEMGGGSWNIGAQFNQRIHQTAWRVFARSERHRRLFGRHCEAGNAHVVVTGHPKFDTPELPGADSPWAAKLSGRTVLLWTPHFTVGDPPTWSTYRLYRDAILATVDRLPELALLIRPHPLFFQSMRQSSAQGMEEERELRAYIDGHPRMALDTNPDHHAAFGRSAALMTDVGSFLLEYLPTGKPLLYLHHPRGLGMNGDGELVSHLDSAQSPEEVVAFVERTAAGLDPMRAPRHAAVPEFLHGLDQHIGQAICEEVLRGVRSGDGSRPGLRHRSAMRVHNETHWRQWAPPEDAPTADADKLALLGRLLDVLPPAGRALDIGCGDGRASLLIARKAGALLGVDLSAQALASAGRLFEAQGQRNARFAESAVEALRLGEKFDLVTCLDLLAHIADDTAYLAALDQLPHLCRHETFVLTCDTVSDGQEQLVQQEGGHFARWRSLDQYRQALAKRGFTCVQDLAIGQDPQARSSTRLFVFQYQDPAITWLAHSRQQTTQTTRRPA